MRFKFKKVDPQILTHSVEKRGFIDVPLDYNYSDGEKISIFYRLIPAYGSGPSDPSKPIIVVINGGPGIPSHVYRPLNYDYQNLDAPQNGTLDRFRLLRQSFRILIADQRGTDGSSSPLDFEDPQLQADPVAKHFSSDNQARDYSAVISAVIPRGEPFFMIAQSYGGMVGMQYLALSESRKPKGIVFSCSALPFEDMKDASLSRRREQLSLNLQLKKIYPDIAERIRHVRTHFHALGLDPDMVHTLFNFLGKSEAGKWEKVFIDECLALTRKTREEIEKQFEQDLGSGGTLNYILSSSNFTPGETDRTIAKFTSREIPFEPWMIDENWVLMQTGKHHRNMDRILTSMDQKPPPPTPFPSLEELRDAIQRNQLLFVSADNDAYVPADAYRRAYQKFMVPGHTHTAHIPGGHHCIFLQAGYEKMLSFTRN